MKTENIFLIICLILVAGLLFYFSDIELFNVQLRQDSIYMNIPDRASTYIEVDQEMYAYEDIHILINKIGCSSSTSKSGVSPQSYQTCDNYDCWYSGSSPCSGLAKNQLSECCQRLGYSRYVSDTGWNVCVKDSCSNPQYVKIFVAGQEVYSTTDIINYPKTSSNFSSIVNSYCGLYGLNQLYCSDSSYGLRDKGSGAYDCVYYQPISYGVSCLNANANNEGLFGIEYNICSMPVEEGKVTNCQVPVTFETGNNQGYLNLGLVADGKKEGTIVLVQPPTLISIDDGNSNTINGDTGDSRSNVSTWIEQNYLFVTILGILIVIGGILLYVKKKG
jgi:hypothetical protein